MKVLLTGGTGYIGSHTAVELIQSGYTVEILDNLSNSKIGVLDHIEKITGVKPKFYQIDLLDKSNIEHLLKTNHYDTVIHFAGLKAVTESIKKPLDYYYNNIVGTLNLLSAMQKSTTRSLAFSSSATVYGLQDTPKFTEENPVGQNITNPYGQTKYMIEQVLKDFSVANPDYKITILRYFNPIGAHSSGLLGEDPNDIPNNLMPIIMKVYTGEIPELSVYGDDYDTPDGTGMRDFIHVVDLAKGHVAAIKHLESGISIYNLGTGKATSVMTLIKTFESVSGKTLPCKIVSRRPGDIAICCADPSKATHELDWHTTLTIKDAVRDTLNYLHHYQQNN